MKKKPRIPCEFKDPKLPAFGDQVPLDLSDQAPERAENVLPQQEPQDAELPARTGELR